ncbi:MAG: hypothetical protein A3G91_05650 [Omnitrophica WOR_2 bacterium RIFCSPLOWO2_12_FULL_50_9]|nr:MAG: hypothetical protein A3G91_05650 [Omnitrophica WOR_2 bacterium RIFCSPLOWO2_12_FULL_50_9]
MGEIKPALMFALFLLAPSGEDGGRRSGRETFYPRKDNLTNSSGLVIKEKIPGKVLNQTGS